MHPQRGSNGDSFVAKNISRLGFVQAGEIAQLKGVHFKIAKILPLDEADQENGLRWQGVIFWNYSIVRIWGMDGHGWSHWFNDRDPGPIVYDVGEVYVSNDRNGSWSSPLMDRLNENYSPMNCQDVPPG